MRTVLIIDDEPLILKATAIRLKAEGWSVITARNGPDGLTMAAVNKPDVVLLDVMMPGMDGWQTLRELKTNPATASIPVVVFTAKEYEHGKRDALERGAADFFGKPFDPLMLARCLARLVDAGVFSS